MPKTIEIEIKNWGKHQRKDVKKPSWFALSNRILEDSKLFDLSDAQWKALIYIFSQASQQGSEKVILNLAHASRVCGISESVMKSTVSHLSHVGVTQTLLERSADVTPQDKTGQDTTQQDKTGGGRPARLTPAAPKDLGLSAEIWRAYSDSYFARYGTEPVRNAKVNGQVAQLAKRLGSEAPDVVRFFLQHNKSYYVSKAHEIGACLSDAEALRTQWATDTKITNRQAKQADDMAANATLLKRIREGSL